jgi:hypothetical protein
MNEPDKGDKGEAVQVGPREGDKDQGASTLIQLVGGPRHGLQERVPPGTGRVKIRHEGKEHEYALGANLPDDFASRTPAQNAPTSYFGYVGPDQEAVAKLANDLGTLDVKRGPEHGPAYGEAKGKPAKPLTSGDLPR